MRLREREGGGGGVEKGVRLREGEVEKGVRLRGGGGAIHVM